MVNVTAKLPPGLTVPESHIPGVSDVVVCGVEAVAFVQTTVVPAAIVSPPGWKAKLTIATAAGGCGVRVGVGLLVGVGVAVGGGRTWTCVADGRQLLASLLSATTCRSSAQA